MRNNNNISFDYYSLGDGMMYTGDTRTRRKEWTDGRIAITLDENCIYKNK